MDVKQFITQTLMQTASSVSESETDDIKFFLDESTGIEFDLAVTVSRDASSKTSKEAKASVTVLSGDYATENSTSDVHHSVSRVKFTVLPRKQHQDSPTFSTGGETLFSANEVF
ncbi:hypothetical protein ACWDUD_16475 [Rhodococcus sp. NPDC003382]